MELLLNNDDYTIQDSLIEMITRNKSIRILSPYLTKNSALNCILEKPNFKLVLVLDFNPDSLLNGASCIDINLIKQLINIGQGVYYNSELHSKLYITDESLIIGSSNFTHNGLFKRKESAIMFKRDFNSKIYSDCNDYFRCILKSSTKVTMTLIDKIIKIVEEKEKTRSVKWERLSEILSNDYIKNSIYDDYDLKNNYPKTLNELQNGLKFDFINHEEIESQYRVKFPSFGRDKNEIIIFIKTNLYKRNKGYNIKTKINNHTSTVYKWYRDNTSEFDIPLRSYKDFYIDRSKELLELYRVSFDIQPITGFFAKRYDYLKGKGIINDSFFTVKFSDFEEQWQLNLMKKKLNEIDEFINKYGNIPDRNARQNIKKMKINSTTPIEDERRLRYEGSLRDRLYLIKKKYKSNMYKQKSMKQIIENYYTKWGWTL